MSIPPPPMHADPAKPTPKSGKSTPPFKPQMAPEPVPPLPVAASNATTPPGHPQTSPMLTSPRSKLTRISPFVPAQELAFYQDRKIPPIETSYRTRLISGTSNPILAQQVADHLRIKLSPATVGTFANGEINIKIDENVRGDDIFIVQPTCGSANVDINTAVMELLLLVHTLRLSSPKRITALVPYFAYSRQDRKTRSRVPISAAVVAQLLQSMGVDRVVTVDLHCGQIQGFFRNLPMDNLPFHKEFAQYFMKKPGMDPATTAVVSPDAGGVERASMMGDCIKAHHIVTIIKRRIEAGKVASMQTVGDVKGYTCIIVDDMVDTAGTLVKACEVLIEAGAVRVLCCATHGILTDPAVERINNCEALEEIVVSDSIPQDRTLPRCEKLTVLSVAPLLAETVSRLHREESLSVLFK